MAVQWHVCEHAPTQSQQWLSAGASWAQQGKRRWCRGYVNGLFKQQQWLRLKKACGRQHTDQLQCCRDLSKGKCRPQTAGFLAHLLAHVWGLVSIPVVLGSCLAALERRLKENDTLLCDYLKGLSQAWRLIPVIPAPGRLRDRCVCRASLSYIVSSEPSPGLQSSPGQNKGCGVCGISNGKCSLESRVGCFCGDRTITII